MKRWLIILCITLFINSYFIESQNSYPVDKWVDYIQERVDEEADEAKIEALYAELSYRADHPFDLNEATESQLKTLPFLSGGQIAGILSYREKYGKMNTLYELKQVEELDFETIHYLLPFVHIGEYPVEKLPVSVENLLKKGRNELQFRYDRCFQQKAGYKTYPDSILDRYPNRRYLGEPFYTALRYTYSFDDRIQGGLVAEKDAGEPFWTSKHKGYDFYSAHLLIKDFGWLKTLVAGDYKASFGQGLILSHDFLPGPQMSATGLERRRNGLRRHFSTNEIDFFRGAGVTLQWKKTQWSAFYSYRRLDGALHDKVFPSLKTDGLHRVEGDWEKRGRIPMQTYGGHWQYADESLCIGLAALSYSFGSYRLEPDPHPYNLFYFRGNRHWNASVHYQWKNNRLSFFGETAIAAGGAVATIDALRITPASYVSWLILYRYYDRRYQAFFGQAFGQTTAVQNEQGLYLGMELVPAARWKLVGYADFFRFPWLKYGVDAPSSGQEYKAEASYTPSGGFSVALRYRYKKKETNAPAASSGISQVLPLAGQRLRLRSDWYPWPSLRLRTSAEGVLQKEVSGSSGKGLLITQAAGWKPPSGAFQGDLSVSWFHTDNYASRLSAYEKQLLYAFNSTSFYGRGLRLAFACRWDVAERLILSAKIGHTFYADRERIGTAQEEIDGPRKTDFSFLLRWKF